MKAFLLSAMLLAAIVSAPAALATDGSDEEIPCTGTILARVACLANNTKIFVEEAGQNVIDLVCDTFPEVCQS